MRKFYDIDREIVITEDELRADYERQKRNGELEDFYEDFGYYLKNCLTSNNGSLEQIADDWMIHRLQRDVASDIACDEMSYGDCLEVIQKYHMFENWTSYEINNRPVDIDAIREMVEMEVLR